MGCLDPLRFDLPCKGRTLYGLMLLLLSFFEELKGFFVSCHFKRKHFLSADIIKDGIGSAKSSHVEGNFALRV